MKVIEVIDYNEKWPENFDKEKSLLKIILGSLSPSIYHIGSTSVIDLAAKPIIDILIEVDDLNALDCFNQDLKKIGYVAKGEFGIPERRYFQKGGDLRSHQIHAFLRGSHNALRHLAFCDYLRNHLDVANEYAALKKDISRTCNNDIEKYCDKKNNFVKKHEQLALEWYT